MAKCEEDVLSYALFPQVATKFFQVRDGKVEAAPAEAPKAKADPNAVRTIYVEDLTAAK